ncbi:MAG: hypothetical protein ACM3IH_03945 [Sphingobacteriales bacterium]
MRRQVRDRLAARNDYSTEESHYCITRQEPHLATLVAAEKLHGPVLGLLERLGRNERKWLPVR